MTAGSENESEGEWLESCQCHEPWQSERKQGWDDAKRHAKIQGCLAGAKLLDLCSRAGFLVVLDKCHHDLAVLECSVFCDTPSTGKCCSLGQAFMGEGVTVCCYSWFPRRVQGHTHIGDGPATIMARTSRIAL